LHQISGHEWAIRASITQELTEGIPHYTAYVRDDINSGYWVFDDRYRHSDARHVEKLTDSLQGHYMLFLEKSVKS
jgi:hypothetical protein